MQQDSLFSSDSPQQDQVAGPVTCLGKTFANDQARRDYFLALLAEKLKDPEFRKIEGFPIGSDEDILNLSDPPYYTACPNPWIGDFIAEWEAQKPDTDEEYHREPFAADVSEGKNDPIYNAHSYHTKVPHKAIMRYILHYTNPGDIVFDGFCGTGMTGVAAQMCGDRGTVASLGYQVKADGTILQEEINDNGSMVWKPFSKLGARKAVLNDLSPAATFIAYNYNTPIDVSEFEKEAARIIKEVEEECGWMYETLHTDGKTKGKINYTVWSDVFICQSCAGEVVFWNEAVDTQGAGVKNEFSCPHCSASLTKRSMERSWDNYFDFEINQAVRKTKQVPVLINYTFNKKRLEKKPDEHDLDLINCINNIKGDYWFPTGSIPKGDKTSEPLRIGITNAHHFYTKRNLITLAAFKAKIQSVSNRYLSWFTSALSWTGREMRLHLGNYFNGGGGVITSLRGAIYIASLCVETNAIERLALRTRCKRP
ncbi:DNA methyltransferase [Pseudaeromonas pectinilytica]